MKLSDQFKAQYDDLGKSIRKAEELTSHFGGAVLLNAAAAKDEAVIAMLESQQARGWPASSGFGNHYTINDLIS
jgi:hypothetical protein